MPTARIACTADAFTSSAAPWATYNKVSRLAVAASIYEIFEFYNLAQIPKFATIESAYLTHYQDSAAASAARTLSLHRVTGTWYESTVKDASPPSVAGSAATVSYTGAGSSGKAWTHDVKTIVQSVVNGATYKGFRIISNSASVLYLRSRTSKNPPVLVVTYSTAPSKPTMCSPADESVVLEARPRFAIDFRDVSGDDKTLKSVQFQFDDTDTFATPTHDSGELFVDTPEFFPTWDLVLDEDVWWRGRTRDGDDNWSDYSDPRMVTRREAPEVELTNPGPDPADIVTEPTPPFSHSNSVGYTQAAVQYRVIDSVDPVIVYWDSTKVATPSTTVVPPDGALQLTPGGVYVAEVGVWYEELASVEGAGPHATASREFTFEPAAGEPVVEDLTFTPAADGRPEGDIGWTDPNGVPDKIVILEDDRVVFVTEDVIDLQVSPGVYKWRAREFTPLVEHTWVVARVVNGIMSAGNPEVTGSATPIGAWISTLDGAHYIWVSGKKPVEWESNEDTELVMPLGAKNPFLVSGNIFGRRGRLNGNVKPHKGQTYEDMVEHLTAMLDVNQYPRGTEMILTLVDTRTRFFWWEAFRSERHEYVNKIPIQAEIQELLD